MNLRTLARYLVLVITSANCGTHSLWAGDRYDFETGETGNVFTPEESPFQDLHFQFDWSKAGRQIAFTGFLKGTGQPLLAVIDVDLGIESMQSVENIDDPDWVCTNGSIDWHPGGDHLLVLNPVGNLNKPFGIALNAQATNIELATIIPPEVAIGDTCYTPGGKSIIAVFTSRLKAGAGKD